METQNKLIEAEATFELERTQKDYLIQALEFVRKLNNEVTKYYYEDGFNIESITRKSKWRKYKPGDKKLLIWLIKEVIQPNKSVNLHHFLRENFPERGDNWRNTVIDNFKGYIYRHLNCNMAHDGADTFWVKNQEDSGGNL